MSYLVDLPGTYLDLLADDSALKLVLANPIPEDSDVEVPLADNWLLEIWSTDIAEALDQATVVITATINGGTPQTVYTGGAFQAGFNGGGSAVAASAIGFGLAWTIDKVVDLDSEDAVSLRVQASSVAPVSYSLDETYAFTGADVINPALLSAQATGPQTVRVVFDESMLSQDATAAGDALNPAMYLLEYDPEFPRIAAVWATVSAVTQISAVTYDLTTDMVLTFDKPYTVSAEGVKDDSLAGNAVSPPTHIVSFTSWKPPSWPANRDFDLYSMFANGDHTQDTSGDLERTCSVLQDVIEILLWQADEFPSIWDIDRAPEAHVEAMLADLGNPFSFDIDLLQKRKLLDLLVPIYQQKGTARGIINLARFFIGLEITAIIPYVADSWILGDSIMGILGETTWLAPSIQANYYSFSVIVDRVLTDEERVWLTTIINEIKCAHEHAFIVEPAAPTFIDHWDLGLSRLGADTYLHG